MPDSKQILIPLAGIGTAIFLIGIIVGGLSHGYFNNEKHILIGYQNGFEAGVKAAAKATSPEDVVFQRPAERYTIVSTTNVTKTVKKLP
jgi:hypothetical protein